MIYFFVITTSLLILMFIFTRARKERSGGWIQFFAKGKEAGFTIKDMEQLRRVVSNCNIHDPVSIFKSQKQLETVIRSIVDATRLSGETNDPSVQVFLSKLFDYFKKNEMANVESKIRITSSRQISEGQLLRIMVPGTGVFGSEVVKNAGNYLTVTRPVAAKNSASVHWIGHKISVYFWREDDAGYVFDTNVVDEVFSKGIASLKLEHNDNLFRTQKRKSLRAKFSKAAFLYLVKGNDNPHRLETTAGLRCMLEDISDTGCAFRINGQAQEGMRLKVQFSIDRVPVCMPATVKAVEYNQEANFSVVRMEADSLPVITRNRILCEVFNLLPEEDEDELPFKALEDEADAQSSTIETVPTRTWAGDIHTQQKETINA